MNPAGEGILRRPARLHLADGPALLRTWLGQVGALPTRASAFAGRGLPYLACWFNMSCGATHEVELSNYRPLPATASLTS
jgi:hypothetical protein